MSALLKAAEDERDRILLAIAEMHYRREGCYDDFKRAVRAAYDAGLLRGYLSRNADEQASIRAPLVTAEPGAPCGACGSEKRHWCALAARGETQ